MVERGTVLKKEIKEPAFLGAIHFSTQLKELLADFSIPPIYRKVINQSSTQ